MKARHAPPPHVDSSVICDPEGLLQSVDVSRSWWLDSSPQGGTDWMVISSIEVSNSDLEYL
eukprot:1473447-Alexandrium_andersonii.AAC.1